MNLHKTMQERSQKATENIPSI